MSFRHQGMAITVTGLVVLAMDGVIPDVCSSQGHGAPKTQPFPELVGSTMIGFDEFLARSLDFHGDVSHLLTSAAEAGDANINCLQRLQFSG